MRIRPLLPFLLLLAPGTALASVSFGLHGELPTIHSPMARYSGEDVEHSLPLSFGARADLGFGRGDGTWVLVDLGARHAWIDFGEMGRVMLDLGYRADIPGSEGLHPFWEAGLGAEAIRLWDHDMEPLALHLGPRFFGGLGLGFGRGKLRPCVGARISFTAATGSFDLPSVEIDDVEIERFYMPSVLALAGTFGLSF